ncbi:Protein of unknown function DUF1296 [Macleaya cordata]|uniref:GBF-interacting protein 1 N-terminal domain-containing protein n=1 Tax=Macleaya cordata TaxID=56857 RepID=A0A200PS55_MACCD|nr:Protein of unknown function DUF1296 [Macleaya cordata]
MSSGGVNSSSSGRGNNNGVSSIPATSKKMVQSLKEIVNCPEHEIYAMLKECNMDPNDTVHRLLSQDTFHEVKSKREKKKEIKETSESRPRAASNTSNRGGRGGADRNVGRGMSTQFSSTESGALRGKPAYRKENGTNAYPGSSSSASGMPGNNINRRPTYLSESNFESKTPSIVSGDVISSSSQPSPAYQSAWSGVPGQVSMADIVKMGRPKASSRPTVSTETSYPKHNAVAPNTSYHKDPLPSESNHDFRSLHDPSFKVSEAIHEAGSATSQHVSHDEWPLAEPSASSGLPVLETSGDHEVYGNPSLVSNLHADRADLHPSSQSDEFRITKGDVNVENLNTESTGSAPSSSRHIQDDSTGGASHFDNDSFNNMNSYQPHRHFDHQEVEDVTVAVSSAAANLQQLSLRKEELVGPPAEDNPAVKIPNHLQVPTADCLHLSFGSFGSGISATYPGPFASKSHENALEEVSVQADVSSVGHSETRNPEYFGDEQFRSTSDGNVDPRTAAGTISYDSPASSQPEVMKQDAAETTHGHNYSFATSVPGYGFESSTQPNTAFSYAHTNPQIQNLAPFSSVMQAYTNSLLASTVQAAARESDVPFSPFLATQSMPTKYSTSVSSISGPTISMAESLKPGVFSTPHPTQQTLPGTSIATGPTLPQHLTVHSYSQPTLPLGHFANMIGYPYIPPSYAYMPSAFQQAYGGNSTYHQSPAAVHSGGMKYTLPQFKNGAPVSSFPQTAAVASGHGGFGGSANIPGNFPLNPSTTPSSSPTGYDDVISSHYKDNSHFLPLQQNDNSAVWVHGPGSRTVSAVPASTYYSFQGQGQQHSGFRQGQQQPSQHYGNLGYPNFYPSQTGVSQEHQQQQTQNDGTLSGSQGPPSKQSHQIWQHSY